VAFRPAVVEVELSSPARSQTSSHRTQISGKARARMIQHINSVYYAMSDQLVVKYEGLRRDIAQFFSLPIPQAVWERMKVFQNDALVRFIEECRNWK
jgi:hypothetical protein